MKKHETMTDNLPITIFLNKIEKRIAFKIKTGHYLESLMYEPMNVLGITKR